MASQDYSLFNFEDPVCEAVESVISQNAIIQREQSERKNIYVGITFAPGAATGHVTHTPFGDTVFDNFAGGELSVEIGRMRDDEETVSDLDSSNTKARDPLTLIVAKIRDELRRTDAKDLNDQLASPKIGYILPLATSRDHDPDLNRDIVTLSYRLDVFIPREVWPKVILTESGMVLRSESGETVLQEG